MIGAAIVVRQQDRVIGWRCGQVVAVEAQDLFDSIGADRLSGIGQDRRDPACLAGLFGSVDIRIAPGQVGHDQPGERSTDDEPDDEQPPVELGVHRVGG